MRPVPDNASNFILAGAARELSGGRTDNTGTVTLTPSATSTTLTRQGVQPGDIIALIPMTAAGSTAWLAGAWAESTAKNTITIHHASNASTTQTMGYVFWGPPKQ